MHLVIEIYDVAILLTAGVALWYAFRMLLAYVCHHPSVLLPAAQVMYAGIQKQVENAEFLRNLEAENAHLKRGYYPIRVNSMDGQHVYEPANGIFCGATNVRWDKNEKEAAGVKTRVLFDEKEEKPAVKDDTHGEDSETETRPFVARRIEVNTDNVYLGTCSICKSEKATIVWRNQRYCAKCEGK